MMLIGTPYVSDLIESGEAELRELLEHVEKLPRTEYYVWESPYTNLVFPTYVNVESIPYKQFDYEGKIDAKREAEVGE